jgi:hypothetical protein
MKPEWTPRLLSRARRILRQELETGCWMEGHELAEAVVTQLLAELHQEDPERELTEALVGEFNPLDELPAWDSIFEEDDSTAFMGPNWIHAKAFWVSKGRYVVVRILCESASSFEISPVLTQAEARSWLEGLVEEFNQE